MFKNRTRLCCHIWLILTLLQKDDLCELNASLFSEQVSRTAKDTQRNETLSQQRKQTPNRAKIWIQVTDEMKTAEISTWVTLKCQYSSLLPKALYLLFWNIEHFGSNSHFKCLTVMSYKGKRHPQINKHFL